MRIREYFSDYSAYHRTTGNQVCHHLGIPLIMASLLGLLSHLPRSEIWGGDYFRLDFGTVLLLVCAPWYLRLNWRIGLPFLILGYGAYFLGRAIPVPLLWVLFVLGWLFQFFGHWVFEKKSPAFFKNFQHLLVGPLWIFSKLIGYQP